MLTPTLNTLTEDKKIIAKTITTLTTIIKDKEENILEDLNKSINH